MKLFSADIKKEYTQCDVSLLTDVSAKIPILSDFLMRIIQAKNAAAEIREKPFNNKIKSLTLDLIQLEKLI